MDKPTKNNVLKFVDYCMAKGLVNQHTGGGWKAACNKILEDYGPDDDVSGIDVPSEIIRFNNRHPGLLSPDSLGQYQARVKTVLGEFGKYLNSPTTYKGVSRAVPTNGKTADKRKTDTSKDKAVDAVIIEPARPALPATKPVNAVTGTVTDTSLVMPFPLRQTFLAQIVIPHDLTKAEAARLSNFIMALARED
jgi:hypothetical protein